MADVDQDQLFACSTAVLRELTRVGVLFERVSVERETKEETKR